MQLSQIANCRGLSGPMVFAVDSKSLPGKIIVHSVRLETDVIDDANFDAINFKMLHASNDNRLAVLAECFDQK